MFDRSKTIPAIPKETVRAAKAIFGRSNVYILIGEHLEAILADVDLQSTSKEAGISTWEETRLALITFFQSIEGLTDIQTIDALRTRIEWKFALHLSPAPPLLYPKDLCGFRQRVLIDPVNQYEFQKLIDRLVLSVPSLSNNCPNLKSLEAVSFVCSVNRLSQAQKAMQQVLEVLAANFPEWLRKAALPHWYGRYNQATARLDVAFLLGQQQFFVEEIGADIHHLLTEIDQSGGEELRQLQEVQVLNHIWSQQYQSLNRAFIQWPATLDFEDCSACLFR
jgi:transposase